MPADHAVAKCDRIGRNFQMPCLIRYLKRRAVFGLALAPVVKASRGDIGMPEPLLDFCDVGFMGQGIGRGCRTQRMDAKALHFDIDACFPAVLEDDVPVDRTGINVPFKRFRAVVLDRAEERAIRLWTMLGHRQIVTDQTLRHCMYRNEPDFVPFALDTEMHDTLAALHVFHAQRAQFLAADAMVKQGGKNGAVANAFERTRWRRIEKFPGLGVAEGRRAAFVAIGGRAFDASLLPRSDPVALD
jgi:hypothetical protein